MSAGGAVEAKSRHHGRDRSELAGGGLNGRTTGDWQWSNEVIEALFAPLPNKQEKR